MPPEKGLMILFPAVFFFEIKAYSNKADRREKMKGRTMNSTLAALLAVVLLFSGCAAGNTGGRGL